MCERFVCVQFVIMSTCLTILGILWFTQLYALALDLLAVFPVSTLVGL